MSLRRPLTLFLAVSSLWASSSCVHELSADLELELAEPAIEDAAIAPAPFFGGDPANDAVFAIDISFWEGVIAEQEMDCFWDSGVRHVVAGTQVEEITRQQLQLAEDRGLSIDAYVYLNWYEDMATQVDDAFDIVDGFQIGRMWLDVEEAPGGLDTSALISRVQQAVARCRERGDDVEVDCGIYTGPGYWKSFMADTTDFAELPLWYAWYNDERLLSSWPAEQFGGWQEPAAKQWAEEVLCGVGVDKDTMQVVRGPSRVVDRTVPAYDGLLPPAPTGLYPQNGSATSLEQVKLSVTPIPYATRYELALEHWNGSSWRPYFTWSTPNAFKLVIPQFRDTTFRFRARAKNAAGQGPWSSWSTFVQGAAAPLEEPPAEEPPPPPPAEEPPPPPPAEEPPPPPASEPAAVDGAPVNLAPNDTSLTSASVTLSCDAMTGAARYQFAVESLDDAGAASAYYTYEKTVPAATFWPQLDDVSYRFRARALVGGAWTPWSSPASFDYP